MKLKNNLHYIVFTLIFTTWIVSMVIILEPFGLLKTYPPTFPRRIDPNIITVFSITSVLSTVISFLIGLDKLGKLSAIKENIRRRLN